MKKSNKKVEAKMVSDELDAPSTTISSSFNIRIFLTDWGIPILGLLLLFFLMVKRDLRQIEHPWLVGYELVDSSKRVQDPKLKDSLLEYGGNLMKTQLALHPYHARLWGIMGVYYIEKKKPDSCIYVEKKAIELGAGTIVNSIEPLAKHDLGAALYQKLSPYFHQKDTALQIIQEAEIKGYENSTLRKFRGVVYAYSGDFDLAKDMLQKYLNEYPFDVDALIAMALNYSNKGMKTDAFDYVKKIQRIEPNNPNIPILLNHINQ